MSARFCCRREVIGRGCSTLANARVLLLSVLWTGPGMIVSAAETPPDLILDNGQPGTSSTGHWYLSGGAEPYGDCSFCDWDCRCEDSLYSRQFGATYTFELPTAPAEEYEVSLWWTEWPSRLAEVPVEIQHARGVDIVYINQQRAGGQWNPIGSWVFDGFSRITIHSVGPGTTCADAVKLSVSVPPVGPPPLSLTVDNGQEGTSFAGTWLSSGGLEPYGDGSLYCKQAGASYTYDVPLPEDGEYEVALWWTEWPSRRTDVSIWVEHAVGGNRYDVDQTSRGGQWNVLCRWDFRTRARITVLSLGDGTTCADAVRLTPVAPPLVPSEVIIDNRDEGCTFTGTWSLSGGADPYGGDSFYSRKVGATSSYRFTVPAPGLYELYLWWTVYPSRSDRVPVEIYADYELKRTYETDQRYDGGQWNFIGAVEIAESGKVTIRSPGIDSTCADALLVRLSKE